MEKKIKLPLPCIINWKICMLKMSTSLPGWNVLKWLWMKLIKVTFGMSCLKILIMSKLNLSLKRNWSLNIANNGLTKCKVQVHVVHIVFSNRTSSLNLIYSNWNQVSQSHFANLDVIWYRVLPQGEHQFVFAIRVGCVVVWPIFSTSKMKTFLYLLLPGKYNF